MPSPVNEEIIDNLPLETELAEIQNEKVAEQTEEEAQNENNAESIEQTGQEEEFPLAVNQQNSDNLILEKEFSENEESRETIEKIIR